MNYSVFDRILFIFSKYKNIIIASLCVCVVLVVISIVKEGYAYRDESEFSEIQSYLIELRNKDESIYNKVNVNIVEKIVRGIDVSSWQGDIDWEKVKDSGVDFAMIRCGFRNLTNSDIGLDSTFHYNIKEANRLDIPVGIYFYSTAINENEVYEEASYVLNLIKDYKVTYLVVYDFELFNQKRTKGVSLTRINNNAVKFLDYIRAHGYHGMLYGNANDLNNRFNLDKFDGYPIWVAHYMEGLNYEGVYEMWQYSDSGKINGISTNVDLNISYVAYEEIK